MERNNDDKIWKVSESKNERNKGYATDEKACMGMARDGKGNK